jgi:hypothetical protein
MATPDGATVAGQPEVAAGWFPVNDHPLDKARYSFDITVPRGYEVVANGFLTGRAKSSAVGPPINGTRANRWPPTSPRSTSVSGTSTSGAPRPDFRSTTPSTPQSPAGLQAVTDSSSARQGEVLDVLGGAFGPYPFPTVGAIVDNQDDLFLALETQTRPVYSKLFWLDAAETRSTGTRSSFMSSPTSGLATRSHWPAGRTSGSTRASRPTPSGCGPSMRDRRRRRRWSWPPTKPFLPTTRSGTS